MDDGKGGSWGSPTIFSNPDFATLCPSRHDGARVPRPQVINSTAPPCKTSNCKPTQLNGNEFAAHCGE
jgi:hypothetical protein